MGSKKGVWLSFDLGVQGDYEGLYAWLDLHEAKECGDSFAYLNYDFSGQAPQFWEHLRDDLRASIKVDSRTRVYALAKLGTGLKGRFVIGRRKNAPWVGYGPAKGEPEVDES